MQTPTHPTSGNGKICYIEIPAIDINISATFYKDVFGWTIRAGSDGTLSFDDTVGEVSGTWVSGRKPATEMGLVISIMVDNIHATLDLVIANRGTIIQPIDVDSLEKTAIFTDPAGNLFGLYQQ